MADIKKFVGFTTADGFTFSTQKEAMQHVLDVKIQQALANTFKGVSFGAVENEYDGMPEFLFSNRDAILAAFKQDVTLRAARKPRDPAAPKVAKAPKAAKATEKPASAPASVLSATQVAELRKGDFNDVGFMDIGDELGAVDVAEDTRAG